MTVAHRLHTVMDSDRILVMDAGSVREFDIPHKLLQDEDGALRQMVEATGPHDAEHLKRIAEETFNATNFFSLLYLDRKLLYSHHFFTEIVLQLNLVLRNRINLHDILKSDSFIFFSFKKRTV